MSNKGNKMSLATRLEIGIANQKDRRKIDKLIEEYISKQNKSTFPNLTDAALYAGISERTLIRYEQSTPEGSKIRQALQKIRDMEKSALINKALTRKYDPRIATLLLKANHGLKEEPTHLEQNNYFNIPPELLAEAIELSRKSKK
jgi:hypothetical protein